MATKKRTTAARSKDTLQDELERVKSSLLNREELDPISAAAEAKRKSELAAQMGTVTSKAVTEKLGALSLDTQATLDALRTTLISSTQELEELREMISIESERLEELYGKDVVAASIATLIEEYEQKRMLFQEEELSATAALKANIDAQKKLEAERKAAAEKERKQNEEEYEYQLQKSRRENTDAFNQKMLESQRAGEEKARELVRGWQEREDAIKAQEDHTAELEEIVKGLPATMEAEKKKHADSIVRAVTSEHGHKVALLEAQAKAAQDLLRTENKSLAADNERLRLSITDLQNKLETANNRIESIAKSAMERDSGQAALAASQRTAEILREPPKK